MDLPDWAISCTPGRGVTAEKTGILYPVPKRQGGQAMVIGLGAVVAVVIVVVIVLARLRD
jgi:hypothetical protein